MAKCIRCDHELELLTGDEYDEIYDEEGVKYYVCPYCGARYDISIPDDDEKENYHLYNEEIECTVSDENHGYEGRCLECGHYLIIMNNFMRSEVYGDVDEEDVDENGIAKDDTIVDILYCPNCGANITATPPKPSEEMNYDWYKEIYNDQQQDTDIS